MFEKFPYTNLHELNLDWIINKLHEIENAAVLSVNGQTGDVVLYQDALVVFPPVTDNQWNIYRQVGNTGDTSIEGIQFIKGQPAQRIAGLQRYNIYDQGNPPPYPVTSVQGQTGDVVVTFPVSSVNGLTGDVVLYQNPVIQYPTTDQNTWNLYRIVTGSDSTTEAAGIQFIKGQAAQRIAGLQRYDIYDQGNPPPYPVTSVNGQTGPVVLTFPVTSVNGQTGDVTITIPVTSVNGQTGAVTIPPFVTDRTVALMDVDTVVSGATQWALSRNIKLGSTVNTADVGILFDTETDGTLKAYIRKKIGNTVTTEKILTPADIPSDTGVISVNGVSGVVSLDGDDIPSTSGSALSVSDVLSGHTLDITDLQNQADAIEENLADYYSASADYAVGDLIIRNDTLWKCNTAITGGEAWNANHWGQTTIADEIAIVDNKLNIDTANETIIGKYNGRILYRKFIPFTNQTGSNLIIGNIPNTGNYRYINPSYTYIQSASNNILPIYYNSADSFIAYLNSAGNILINVVGYTGSGVVCAEYTKT